jgi:hypothetical protein
MPAWLDAITSPLKAASESVQKLIEIRDLIKFGDALGKLQAQILAAQQGALAAYERELTLLARVSQLEKEVASFDTWKREKQRYERKHLGWGAFAYMLKKAERGHEAPHWVCTNCYEHRHIATMQFGLLKGVEEMTWFCPSCKNTIRPSSATNQWIDDNGNQTAT